MNECKKHGPYAVACQSCGWEWVLGLLRLPEEAIKPKPGEQTYAQAVAEREAFLGRRD